MPTKRKHLDSSKGLFGRYADYMHDNLGKLLDYSIEKVLNYNIGQNYNPKAYKEFIKDWYAQRNEQISKNILDVGATKSDWNKQMKNIDKYSWYNSSNALPSYIKNKLTNNERNVGYVEGMTLPDYRVVYFNQPDYRKIGSSIQVHEGTHTQNPIIQKKAMRNRIHLQDGVYEDSYYDDLDEINSRIMEFRYANRLNPRKKYSIKEIKQMRDYGDGGASWPLNRRPLDILNRYSDDTLLFLINDLASNNRTNRSSNVYVAKYGGTIHIKPKNRGKFNALKKRTGKTTEELTHSKNPLTRKRAIFAQNARKWNHKKK